LLLPLFNRYFVLSFFCSIVDWALCLFYKFNCWANRYFEEGKKNAPAHHSENIEQSLPVDEEFRKSTCPAGVYKKKKYVPSMPMDRPII
jgi:trehalose utilization protein